MSGASTSGYASATGPGPTGRPAPAQPPRRAFDRPAVHDDLGHLDRERARIQVKTTPLRDRPARERLIAGSTTLTIGAGQITRYRSRLQRYRLSHGGAIADPGPRTSARLLGKALSWMAMIVSWLLALWDACYAEVSGTSIWCRG